jgi:hypothetical protein
MSDAKSLAPCSVCGRGFEPKDMRRGREARGGWRCRKCQRKHELLDEIARDSRALGLYEEEGQG